MCRGKLSNSRGNRFSIVCSSVGFVFTTLLAQTPLLLTNDRNNPSAFSVPALDAEYSIRYLDTSDGLPANHINSIIQTSDGFIWASTQNGLARYDGVLFTTLKKNHFGKQPYDQTTSIVVSRDGQIIWIGNLWGLARISTNGLSTWKGPDESFQTARWILGFDQKERPLLGGDRFLYQFDGTEFQAWPDQALEEPKHAKVVRQWSDGSIWIGGIYGISHNTKGLEEWEPILPKDGTSTDVAWKFLELKDGRKWVTTANGLYEMTEQGLVRHVRWQVVGRRAHTGMLLQDNRGQIWFSVSKLGVYRLDPDKPRDIFRMASLDGSYIGDGIVDAEENLWIATGSKGIAQLIPRSVQMLQETDGEMLGGVECVYAARNSTELWAGTTKGLFKFERDRWHHKRLYAKIPSENTNTGIQSLDEDAQGRLWYACSDGIGFFFNNRYHLWKHSESSQYEGESFNFVYSDRSNRIWFGSRNRVYRIKAALAEASNSNTEYPFMPITLQQEPEQVEFPLGLDSPDIRTMLQDRLGRYWFGSQRYGLLRFDEESDTWKRFGAEDRRIDEAVTGLAETKRGIWSGYTDSLAYIDLSSDRFQVFAPGDEFPFDYVNTLFVDSSDHLWIGLNNGLVRLAKSEMQQDPNGENRKMPEYTWFGKEHGLRSPQISGKYGHPATQSGEERIYFPTSNGIASVQPKAQPQTTHPFRVAIRLVTVGDRVAYSGMISDPNHLLHLNIDPNESRAIRIFFSANSFRTNSSDGFSYRMLPIQEDWVSLPEGRDASFNTLEPGQYTFEVRTRTDKGPIPHTTNRITIVVHARFVETAAYRWSLVLAGILLVALVHWFYRRYMLKLHSLEKTSSIQKERLRIARDLHDDLGASLTRVAVHGESILISNSVTEDNLRNHIHSTAKFARELSADIHDLVWANDPRNDDLSSTVAYLRQLTGESLDICPLKWSVETADSFPKVAIGALARRHLLLCMKEGLMNVINHSNATEARVTIRCTNNNGKNNPSMYRLDISIIDNGTKWAHHSTHGEKSISNGLRNIQERMSEIGGQASIVHSPECGTTLNFWCPL